MSKNVESTENLLEKSKNIKALGKDLEKNTQELDTMMKNQNWWCFS